MFRFIIFVILFFSLEVYALRIVALGDSATAGYGVSKKDSYPSVLERELQKKYPKVKVINAGISGATTASAMSNLKWQLRQPFDILIICLGGNDGLRGLKLESSEKNLAKAIDLAKEKGVKVLLAGMLMPPNLGKTYTKNFKTMYRNLAKKKKVKFAPFLLKDVAGVKELNLPDGIHPNKAGYEIIAKNLISYVEELL